MLLLLPQRIKMASEFVAAVTTGVLGSGVLLSGPNGVGKSGVGLLAYLLCAARRLLVVYLSRAESWVAEAQRGEGDAYLLSAMWAQNADLIAASAPLRRVFSAALRDANGAFTVEVMNALRLQLSQRGLGFGVILDEVQHITAAILRLSAPAASQAERTAALYFCHNWHDWMNDNDVFVRMSIASAHGERDFKLPSGEEHRLRIVEPLTDSQRDALQSHSASPAFVRDADARQRILFCSGNVLRPLVNVARTLPSSSAVPRALLSTLLRSMQADMQEDCARWLASLDAGTRAEVAALSMELVAGRLPWTTAKGLYDAGIMYRTEDSDLLRPVSAAAAAAYLVASAKHTRGAAKPLSIITDGRTRGFELERQVMAHLTTFRSLVASKALSGSPAAALWLRSDFALPFKTLAEVVPRDQPVLYLPTSRTFPCDGILVMPAFDDEAAAIVILECSTTMPRDAERVRKVRRYLGPTSVLGDFHSRFPALQCIVALVYDGDLSETELSGDAAALSGCKPPVDPLPAMTAPTTQSLVTAPVIVRVLDRRSLTMLGVAV